MNLVKATFTYVPGGTSFDVMVPSGTTVSEALTAAGKTAAGYAISIDEAPAAFGSEIQRHCNVVLSQKVEAGTGQ